MNGNNQPQQDQHHIAERIAHIETAIDYQGRAIEELRGEMVRVHEQMMKIRTTDFRLLLSINLTTAIGTLTVIIKMFGLL